MSSDTSAEVPNVFLAQHYKTLKMNKRSSKRSIIPFTINIAVVFHFILLHMFLF